MLYTRGENDQILILLNLSTKNRSIELPGNWDTVLLQASQGDIHIDKKYLNIAPFGGAILTK